MGIPILQRPVNPQSDELQDTCLDKPDLPISHFYRPLESRCLAESIAQIAFGKDLGQLRDSSNFADGEIYVRYEESIRGCRPVFLIQSTQPPC